MDLNRIILLLAFVLLSAISHTTAQSSISPTLGFALSPAGFPGDYSQLTQFLEEAAGFCGGAVVYGNAAWRDAPQTSGKIPTVQKLVCTLQPAPYPYIDMINFGWRAGETLNLALPENPVNDWTNDDAKNRFLQTLISTADSLKPTFFFIGNEVSFYWQQDSTDYLNWVQFYHQAYDSIKAHSPESQVGTVFNYEHLAGVGAPSGFSRANWGALAAIDSDKVDVWGLTLYPFFSVKRANDIPDDYLDPFFARIGAKPVVLTETGWPADSLIGTWHSSAEEQVSYVDKLFSLLEGRPVKAVNWLFLNYMMDNSGSTESRLFRSVALRDSLGNDRPALHAFFSHCAGSRVENTATPPETIRLGANYPNPFNGATTIPFYVATPGNVRLAIYDINGRFVTSPVHDYYLPGEYSVSINLLHQPSGVYLYTLRFDDSVITAKMVLLE